MAKVKIGQCPVCKDKGVKLTEHHVIEAPKDEEGSEKTIHICKKCHDNQEDYRNALRDNLIEIDRKKLARKGGRGRTNDEYDDEMTFTDDMYGTSKD